MVSLCVAESEHAVIGRRTPESNFVHLFKVCESVGNSWLCLIELHYIVHYMYSILDITLTHLSADSYQQHTTWRRHACLRYVMDVHSP